MNSIECGNNIGVLLFGALFLSSAGAAVCNNASGRTHAIYAIVCRRTLHSYAHDGCTIRAVALLSISFSATTLTNRKFVWALQRTITNINIRCSVRRNHAKSKLNWRLMDREQNAIIVSLSNREKYVYCSAMYNDLIVIAIVKFAFARFKSHSIGAM